MRVTVWGYLVQLTQLKSNSQFNSEHCWNPKVYLFFQLFNLVPENLCLKKWTIISVKMCLYFHCIKFKKKKTLNINSSHSQTFLALMMLTLFSN